MMAGVKTNLNQTERESCPRCGGTGKMPFSVYGGVCFECQGRGSLFTKRGQEAERYLRELRSRVASDLKVGDVIRVEHMVGIGGVVRVFCPISKIETVTAENCSVKIMVDGIAQPYGLGNLVFTFESQKYGQFSVHAEPEKLFRLALTAEQKADTLNKALVYQDSLDKQGKVRKQ